MARYAIATEDKQARREAILDAAKTLFLAGDGTLPSAGDIANASKLAKGTVYLYFRTKEEIFSALLAASLLDSLKELESVLSELKGRRADKVASFIASFVSIIESRPELLRLDAISYGVLEKNLEAETMLEVKREFIIALSHTASMIEFVMKIAAGRGVLLLMRTFAMTRGIWQASQPCDIDLLDEALALPVLQPVFHTELTEALNEYWRGALAS